MAQPVVIPDESIVKTYSVKYETSTWPIILVCLQNPRHRSKCRCVSRYIERHVEFRTICEYTKIVFVFPVVDFRVL